MRSVRDEYDALSSRYEMRWRDYIRRSVHETLVRANIQPGDRLLDIGCGTGALLREVIGQVPSVNAVGIDVSFGMLRTARSRISGVSLLAADADLLPFQAQSFDSVITSSSFHFWPDPQHALIEIRRVLQKNGQLVITDWCDDFVACRICDAFLRWRDVSLLRIFSQTECTALLQRVRLSGPSNRPVQDLVVVGTDDRGRFHSTSRLKMRNAPRPRSARRRCAEAPLRFPRY
jgi:SAM-dependent methyltransferase